MDVVTLALSKQYTKEQINNLLSVGFLPVVVDTLPEISAADSNKIYLVPSEKVEGNNNYLEYLVVEGAWECIGSTAINFEEYATKEELEQAITDKATQEYVDEAIANISNEPSILMLSGNASSIDLTKVGKFVTNVSKVGNQKGLLIISGYMGYPATICTIEITKNTTIKGYSLDYLKRLDDNTTISENKRLEVIITGTWNSNYEIFTCTKVNLNIKDRYEVLDTANTTEYTPTSNYHPATKKYVDDTVNTAHADTQEYIEEVVQSMQTAQETLAGEIQTMQNYIANTLTIFEGDEDEYLALTQEQRDNYLIAIVNPLAVLKEEETFILNSILLDTEQTATIVDLTDEEVEEEVNEIIGGAQ